MQTKANLMLPVLHLTGLNFSDIQLTERGTFKLNDGLTTVKKKKKNVAIALHFAG